MSVDQPIPPAPTGGGTQHDPYDFLYQKPPKKGLSNIMPSANSTKQRILFVVLGGLVVLVVFVVILALILGSGSGKNSGLVSLAQQQTEIIRVSTEVSQQSQSPDTLAFSQNIQYSTTTDKQALSSYMSQHGIKVSRKTLGLSQNTNTDKTLTAANQAGDYDDVAVSTLQSLEQAYQKQLATVFKTATPSQKVLINQLYIHTVALLKNRPAVQANTNS